MQWTDFDDGATLGQRGSESGIILRDDEHPLGARITLERDGNVAPYAITCGIYGWMMHTHFLSSETDAQRDYALMRDALAAILAGMATDDAREDEACRARTQLAIEQFVEHFR